MKPVENIFGYECSSCEYNRNCYGGNMGNQFKYCQKSTEKIEKLERLVQENEQLKRNCNIGNENLNFYREEYKKLEDNWNKLKEYLHNQIPTDKTVLTKHIKIFEVLDRMQELERGVSDE